MGKIDYSQAVSFSYSSGSSAVDEEEDEDLVKERKRREESVRRAKVIEERKRAARGGRGRGRGRGRGGGQRKAPPSAAAQQRRRDTGPEPLESIDEASESRMNSAATSVKVPSARGRGRGRGRPVYNAGPSRPVTSQSLRPVTSQSQRPDTSKSKRPETSQSKRPITAQSNHSEPKEKPPPAEPKVVEEEPKKEEPKEEEPEKEEQKEEQKEQPVPVPEPAKKKKFSGAVRASMFMRSLFGKKKKEEPEPEPEPEVKEEEKEEEEKPEEKKESEEEAAKQEDEEEKKDEEKEEAPPPPPPPPPKSPTPEPKEPEADTEPKKEEEEPVPEPEPKPESPTQASSAEEEGAERKSLVSIKEEPKEEVKQEEKIKTPEPPQDEEMTEEDKEKARGILSSIFGNRKGALAPAVRASRTSLQSIATVDSDSQEDKPKKGFFKGLFGRKKPDGDDESMRASRVSLNRSRVSLQHSIETGNSPRTDPVVNIKPPTPPKDPSPPPPPTPPPPPRDTEQKPETSTGSNRPVVIINTSPNDGSFQRTLIEALRGNVSTEDSEQTQPKQTQPSEQPQITQQPQIPQQPHIPQQPQGVPPNMAYTGLSPQMVPYPMFQPPPQPFYGQPNPYMYPPQMMPGYGGYPGGYPGAFPQFNMSMPPVNNPMIPQQQNMVYQQQQHVQQAMPVQQQPRVQQQANQISYSNTQPMTGGSSYNTPRGQVVTTNNNQPLHIVEKLDAALEAERRRPSVPEDEFEDSDSDDNFYSAEQRRIRRKKRRAKEGKRTERERRRRDEEEREREREEEREEVRKSEPRTPPPPDIDLAGLLSLIETGQEPPSPGGEDLLEDGQQSRPESTVNEKVPLTEEDELSRLLAQLGAAPSSGTPVPPKSAKNNRRKSAPKVAMETRENTLLTMLRDEDKRLDQLKNNSNRRKSTTDFRTHSRGDGDKRSSVPNLGLFPVGPPGVQSPGQFSGVNAEQPRTMSAERLLHEAQKKLMSVQQSLRT